jgi:hypothetical protein
MYQGPIHIMYVSELFESCLMLTYSPLCSYLQPALSNDGKQHQPALGDFTLPIQGIYKVWPDV